MKTQLGFILRLALMILIAAGILSALIGGVGWALGWRSALEFSNGFFVVGAGIVVLGAYAALGGFRQRGDFNMTYARSAGPASLEERAKQMVADMNQGQGTMIVLGAVGLLLVGISVLIPNALP